MPSVSERQRRFMGADLARARSGKRTRTGMSESQLSDFAHKGVGMVKHSASKTSHKGCKK